MKNSRYNLDIKNLYHIKIASELIGKESYNTNIKKIEGDTNETNRRHTDARRLDSRDVGRRGEIRSAIHSNSKLYQALERKADEINERYSRQERGKQRVTTESENVQTQSSQYTDNSTSALVEISNIDKELHSKLDENDKAKVIDLNEVTTTNNSTNKLAIAKSSEGIEIVKNLVNSGIKSENIYGKMLNILTKLGMSIGGVSTKFSKRAKIMAEMVAQLLTMLMMQDMLIYQ
ncbi:hypothetical protein [Campylobacter geochelonis]|uniref:hypothetical protein n=1 Tax=Campylobacter geochelonis TaxID=1780362 RepID=UPI00155DB1C5|nr:hypothetical protein [Campylobacter geochelonis]QKF70522.1 hypothetical protein CGEO_0184 [Campylobacter geochelonis]